MASIDFEQRVRPRKDGLGLSFFIFHSGIGEFVLAGWLISSYELLAFYLLLLPLMAMQWLINRGSCIINNVESWLRTGRWRDPDNCEEAAFLAITCEWLFALRPDPVRIDRLTYCAVLFLWLLGLGHVSLLAFA